MPLPCQGLWGADVTPDLAGLTGRGVGNTERTRKWGGQHLSQLPCYRRLDWPFSLGTFSPPIVMLCS